MCVTISEPDDEGFRTVSRGPQPRGARLCDYMFPAVKKQQKGSRFRALTPEDFPEERRDPILDKHVDDLIDTTLSGSPPDEGSVPVPKLFLTTTADGDMDLLLKTLWEEHQQATPAARRHKLGSP